MEGYNHKEFGSFSRSFLEKMDKRTDMKQSKKDIMHKMLSEHVKYLQKKGL